MFGIKTYEDCMVGFTKALKDLETMTDKRQEKVQNLFAERNEIERQISGHNMECSKAGTTIQKLKEFLGEE